MWAEHPLPAECSGVVLDADTISRRVSELAAEIRSRHPKESLHLVTVLRGGVVFIADLCRELGDPVTVDFLAVSAFAPGGMGTVRLTKDLDDPISGQTVILVEDVIDTGLTVNFVRSFLLSHQPRTFELCTLLDKPARRIAEVPIDYTGFSMSDRFLVGYGLDLAGRHRNLPYIAELRTEAVFG